MEELVFHSDVIARANLLSAEPVALLSEDRISIVSGKPEVVKGEYHPYFRFRFEVLEYLKGEGDDELSVVVYAGPTGDSYVVQEESFEEVQHKAEITFSHLRDSSWDDREAIIFLKHSNSQYVGEDSNYMEFTSRWSSPNIYRYAISSTHTKAWLPSVLPGSGGLGKGEANALSNANAAEPRYLTDVPQSIEVLHSKGLVSTTEFSSDASIALSGIERLIEDNEELLAKGRDIPGYEECLSAKFAFDAEYKQHPPEPYTIERQIASGRPAGHPVWPVPDATGSSAYYERWWTTGPDSDLFIYKLDDPDNDPTTGYAWQEQTTRPVPQGIYRIFYEGQPAEWVLCDYNPEAGLEFRQGVITVTAPADALHEAFFDPVALGDAVGADGASGVLKPASFAFDGSDAALERIDWLDGQARMALAPHTMLADHHIDFIALDGSVSLRLDFDDAVAVADDGGGQTLVWGVCSQPWQSGDLLMLRISESPADLAGATFNADCAPSETPASPTATPEVTPTETPVPTPTAAPTLTPIPTVSSISAPKAAPTPEQADTVTPTPTP